MSKFFVGAEFYTAIEDNNPMILREGIAEVENKLFHAWFDSNRQIFEDELAVCIQRAKRARKQLDEWRNNPAYQLGKLEGLVQAYSSLYQEEKRQNTIDHEITAIIPRPGGVTRKILYVLYDLLSSDQWITHGALARKVETTETSLTNIMKKLVLSHAVESEKSGKYTNYRLTEAGKRYYEKKLASALPDQKDSRIFDCLYEIKQSITSLEKRMDSQQNIQTVILDSALTKYLLGQKTAFDNRQNEESPVPARGSKFECYESEYESNYYSNTI